MKWVAIAGTWIKTDSKVESDVRKIVREIIYRGDGVVSGGALGVDYIATSEALLRNGKLKIIIPSTLETYRKHYSQRAEEGVITKKQSGLLISQLEEVKKRDFLVEGVDTILNKESYFNRITKIIESADELVAFHINQSEGTQNTIDKAIKKGIPVKTFSYALK
jgi:hypothetical protein